MSGKEVDEPSNIEPADVASFRDIIKRLMGRLSDVGPILSLLGLFSYGLARFAIDAFFERFKIAPEDVGLGYASILGPAAFLTTAIFAFSAITLFVLSALPERVQRAPQRLAKVMPTAAFVLASQLINVIFAAVALGLFILFRKIVEGLAVFGGPNSFGTKLVLSLYALGIGSSVVVYALRDLIVGARRIAKVARISLGVEDEEKISQPSRLVAVLQVLVAVAVLGAVLFAAHRFGAQQASQAAVGRSVEIRLAGILAPGLSARHASVAPASNTANLGGAEKSRCLMHIGEGGGFAIFYEVDSRRTIRLPVGLVVISEATHGNLNC